MWIDRINELVPSGLLRVREDAGAFYRLGMPKWRALSKAFDAKAAWEMNWARLPCYPPGFLDSLRYVVDIGANDGGWSRAFLKFTKPEKWLVVEPNPEMLEVAAECLKDFPFLRLEGCALSNFVGEREFFITEHSHNSSLLVPHKVVPGVGDPGFNVGKIQKVKVSTLDTLLADWPRVDLLKIDTQGNEKDVLSGARETLKKTTAVLVEADFVREYEGQSLFPDVHAVLESSGLTLQSIFTPADKTGALIWADAFYRRIEK